MTARVGFTALWGLAKANGCGRARYVFKRLAQELAVGRQWRLCIHKQEEEEEEGETVTLAGRLVVWTLTHMAPSLGSAGVRAAKSILVNPKVV